MADSADTTRPLPTGDQTPVNTPSLRTFADRLDYLFKTVHPQDQRPYSYEYVADAVSREGIDISGNYIWMLRSGRRDNPTLRHMEGLARFFGVSTAFLTDHAEAERARDQLEKLDDLASSGVQHVAMRGATVNEETLDVIHGLLDRVRELTDGLRPADQQPKQVSGSTDPESR